MKPFVRGSRRLFKGGTRENVIQTLDIGASFGEVMRKQAQKFPGRKYAVVDPVYESASMGGVCYYKGKPFLIQKILDANKRAGVITSALYAREKIAELARKGIKLRHVNFQMPNPAQEHNYNFEAIFHGLKRVLLPNGKIFMSSENIDFLERIVKIAKRNGYVVQFKKKVVTKGTNTETSASSKKRKEFGEIGDRKILKTLSQKAHFDKGYEIYFLTLTLSPKTVRKDKKIEEQNLKDFLEHYFF
jgi:tRNA G46 methylase TrmB